MNQYHYDVVVYDSLDADKTQQGLQKIEELKTQGKVQRAEDSCGELKLVMLCDDVTFEILQSSYNQFSPEEFAFESIVNWSTSLSTLNNCAGIGYIDWPSQGKRIRSNYETFIYSEDKELESEE